MPEPLEIGFDGPAGPLRGWTVGDLGGPGTPVLYLHPINMESRAWHGVAATLADQRPALMVDLRGHGGSVASGPYGTDPWLEDVRALLDHVGAEHVDAVGGSLGGTLAVLLATRHPDVVRSVASFGGTLHVEGDVQAFADLLAEHGVAGTFRALVPQLSLAPEAPPEVVEAALALTNPNNAEVVTDVLAGALATDVRAEVGELPVPALVVNGEHDKTCPPEQGRQFASAVGVEMTLLEGVGHLPMLEAPEQTVRLLSEHLAAADR